MDEDHPETRPVTAFVSEAVSWIEEASCSSNDRKACRHARVHIILTIDGVRRRTVTRMDAHSSFSDLAALGFVLLGCLGCGGEIDAPEASPDAKASSTAGAKPAAPEPTRSSSSGPSDRCTAPERVALADGAAVIRGETTTASDEFPSLDCESRGTADTLVGPQRYYALSVHAGRTYRFALTPTFHAVLFGFEADVACTPEAIQLACRSGGRRGFASGLVNPGTGRPGATVFAVPPPYMATRDVELVIVVDSDYASGSYELAIREE